MKKKVLMIISIMIVLASAVSFAAEPTENTEEPKPLDSGSFYMHFDKPAKDEFYFSDPDNLTKKFVAAPGGGLEFPIKNDSVSGSPATAYIGIYYNLESKGTLEVWCNAVPENTASYRLTIKKDGNAGLNYMIGIGADKAKAINNLQANKKYVDFDGSIADVGANIPVLTIYSHTVDPGTETKDNVFYSNSGVLCLAMETRARRENNAYTNYIGGQYSGYIMLRYTSAT